MAKTATKKDQQMHFEEKFLEDPELAQIIDQRFETRAAAARYARINVKLRVLIASRGLVDNVRYRVNGFVFRLSTNKTESRSVAVGETRRFAELKADDHGAEREED
jgi:hypothetical protein